MTTSAAEAGALPRLLQLASPTLPVGGFSYSQGLESAVALGLIHDAGSAADWIAGVLAGPVGGAEAGFLLSMLRAWRERRERPDGGLEGLAALDALFQASRESQQLLAETRQMAWSLTGLLAGLPPEVLPAGAVTLLADLQVMAAGAPRSYPLAWSCAAVACGIAADAALTAYLWGWLENQVMAALKSVPLGQSVGQALLFRLGQQLTPLVARVCAEAADSSRPDPWDADGSGPGNFAPGFALACTHHELQYSRLFRS